MTFVVRLTPFSRVRNHTMISIKESLKYWAEDVAEGRQDPGWHTHIEDDEGNELTISISV
jgi:hypothetical protein